MSKNFIRYLIGWLAAIGLFNLITFITPADISARDDNPTLFYTAYAFITVAFIAQLICSYFVIEKKITGKTFFDLSILTVSIAALVAMLAVGSLCMMFSFIPDWIGIILCAIVLAVYIIALTGTSAAVNTVNKVEVKIKEQTFFIKSISIDATTLVSQASGATAKKAATDIYEALRYSDPMSSAALADVEQRISVKFREFSAAVTSNNEAAITSCSSELKTLITERNAKCKLLK